MLKKRGTAVLILAAVLVLGTVFGTNRSLSQLRGKAENVFYEGMEHDGYGIQNKLEQRTDKAKNLCKLAAGYDVAGERDALLDAADALMDASNAEEKFWANAALTDAADALNAALQKCELSEEDQGYVNGIMADLASYELQLERLKEDYNTQVREFNDDVLGAFPANVLKALTGIHELEEFA